VALGGSASIRTLPHQPAQAFRHDSVPLVPHPKNACHRDCFDLDERADANQDLALEPEKAGSDFASQGGA
jgi:hypothetical protein